MDDNNKANNLKEKLKQALASTVRVISDDLVIKDHKAKDKSSKNLDFLTIDNLNSKSDFLRFLVFLLLF